MYLMSLISLSYTIRISNLKITKLYALNQIFDETVCKKKDDKNTNYFCKL